MVVVVVLEVESLLALVLVLTLALQALARALPREEELELLVLGVTSIPRNASTISLGVDEDGVVVAVVDMDKGETEDEEAVEDMVRLNKLVPRGSVEIGSHLASHREKQWVVTTQSTAFPTRSTVVMSDEVDSIKRRCVCCRPYM